MFLQEHRGATALLVVTMIGAALAEWVVTFRERRRTTLPADADLGTRIRLGLRTLVETTTVRTQDPAPEDRGTKVILVGALVIAIAAGWTVASTVTSLEVPGNGWAWVLVGVVVIWLGIALRVWAIAALGRFFRRDVLIQQGHEVVTAGPFRVVRHPAYAGNLIACLGLGIALGNSLALVILVVVPLLGHIPRIRVEEAALAHSLGEPYSRYAATTARIVPGVW
jgi:protein-S-isoprenylcysteine O-methyltransferase Ste14